MLPAGGKEGRKKKKSREGVASLNPPKPERSTARLLGLAGLYVCVRACMCKYMQYCTIRARIHEAALETILQDPGLSYVTLMHTTSRKT